MSATHTTDFGAVIGPVARKILGEPTDRSRGHILYFGSNGGSLKVDTDKGVWYDHGDDCGGGGTLPLIQHSLKLDKAGALKWMEQNGFKEKSEPAPFKITGSFIYRSAEGEVLYRVLRMEDGTGKKQFPQFRADGKGGWISGLGSVQPVLYRLPELVASDPSEVILIPEGEKMVEALRTMGFVATSNSGGANARWKPEYNEHLAGRHVVVLPDNDAPGEKHGLDVARSLTGMFGQAASVRLLRLPDLKPKGDIVDWIASGGTADQLWELIEATPLFKHGNPEPDETTDDNVISDSSAEPMADPVGALGDFDLTEDGLALAFAAEHGEELRFDHTRGSWYRWSGKAWREDRRKQAFHFARRICRDLAKNADATGKLALTLAKAATASAVEKFAAADDVFAVTHEIWDADPWLLGTPEGSVDLRTGVLRRSNPEDYISRLAAVGPAPTADCPRWLEFLNQTTGNDQGLISFLRQWCGYSLTGVTHEHALLFVFGPGGNGKSVFLNVLSQILGKYAATSSMETFTASKSDRHPTDLAMLRGARLVTASETEEGRAWAESRIKQMTGGDPVSARFMRQDFFTFLPQFKLTIIGNNKPVLHNVDDAAKRRIKVVPFVLKPAKPDRQLEQKLQAEWPGILRWMIDGCLDWQANGLIRPDVVVQATATYFSEQDTLSHWVEDCCDRGPGEAATTESLFKSWSAYTLSNGEQPGTAKKFAQMLIRLGCEQVRETPNHRGKRGFKGIALKPPEPMRHYQDKAENEMPEF